MVSKNGATGRAEIFAVWKTMWKTHFIASQQSFSRTIRDDFRTICDDDDTIGDDGRTIGDDFRTIHDDFRGGIHIKRKRENE